MQWLPLDREGVYRTQYKLKIGRTNLQDLMVDFDDYTEYIDDIFSIKKFDFIPTK